MAVETAFPARFGVVEVHPFQPVKADQRRKSRPERFVPFLRPEVVTRRVTVAGVDADADPFGTVQQFDQPREVLQREPDVAALSGGVFDHGVNCPGRVERAPDARGDFAEAILDGNLIEVAAGVKIELRQTERFAAAHFPGEGFGRKMMFFRVGLAEVDEIAVVRQDLPGRKAVFPAMLLKCGDFGRVERRGAPLALVFGEHGEGVRADCRGVQGGVGDASGDADMGSEVFHRDKIFCFGVSDWKKRFLRVFLL